MKLILLLSFLILLIACQRKKIDSSCCSNPATQIVFDGGYLSVPNLFTPDGDGYHDWFVVQSVGLTSFNIEVENKNGKSFYSSTDTSFFWDAYNDKNGGTLGGFFYYHVTATGIDGTQIDEHGTLCVISEYHGCIKNTETCVFESNWDGTSFVEPVEDDIYGCP